VKAQWLGAIGKEDQVKETKEVATSPLERGVMPGEAAILFAHHKHEADYWLACKQTNMKHSENPPNSGGKVLTKEDWLDRAKRFDEKRKFHRQRARIFLAMMKA
jgi:hypothetical protein